MKKITVLGLIVLFLSFILISCQGEPEVPPAKKFMTFVDNINNPGRRFIIYDDLSFKVSLLEPFFEKFDENGKKGLTEIGFVAGLIVMGNIKETNDSWLSDTITGKAQNMSANDSTDDPGKISVDGIFKVLNLSMGFKMIYTKNYGEITAVKIEFLVPEDDPEMEDLAKISEDLMGGDYIRVTE